MVVLIIRECYNVAKLYTSGLMIISKHLLIPIEYIYLLISIDVHLFCFCFSFKLWINLRLTSSSNHQKHAYKS